MELDEKEFDRCIDYINTYLIKLATKIDVKKINVGTRHQFKDGSIYSKVSHQRLKKGIKSTLTIKFERTLKD